MPCPLIFISYKKKVATANTPAVTAPKLATFTAAEPVKGLGVALVDVTLLEPLPPLLVPVLFVLVLLVMGRKLAHVRRVVL